MDSTKYPKDLANVVFSEIEGKKTPIPSLELLVSIFESMYFASIKTEESEPIIFNIVYLDPSNPDPNPPDIIVHDRWEFVKFSDPIQLNLPNIIKLAKASDPRSSSLAIYPNGDNEISIWGLIDQGNRYHDYVNYEAEGRPERPGVFQASLEGPGHIVAYIQYQKIAELRVNSIVQNNFNVFYEGPIKDKLQVGLDSYLKSIKRKLDSEDNNDITDLDSEFSKYWFSTICRLILRIKNYRHGGSLLLSNERIDSGLNVKYQTTYNRLRLAIINRAVNIANSTSVSNNISNYVERNENIPLNMYLEEVAYDDNLNDTKSEIDGSLWFISLLSRVDGLILLNKRLDVRGFGVEIKTSDIPDKIFICSSRTPTKTSIKEANYNHFGTRHRSMMRYCWKYEKTVGFVISQDGEVRAITKHEDKLLIWDNIKLQAHSFIRKKIFKKRIKQ